MLVKEIERPQDLLVKSIINKSGLKVHIIQSVDRKLDLVDVAAAKRLKLDDLIHEIETIVLSGTKLNISYYIDSMMDSDKQDEIIEYFKESESDSLEDAIAELGEEDFTQEKIRLNQDYIFKLKIITLKNNMFFKISSLLMTN